MEKDFPDSSSEYADEGTAAHEVLSKCLLGKLDAVYFKGEVIKAGEREFVVDEEMVGHVQWALDIIRNRQAGGWTLLVEQHVFYTQAIGSPTEQGGTSDVILISPSGEAVEVWDFKYGAGIKVFAEENHQMLSYGLGVLETFGGLFGDFKVFLLGVLQPRMDHCDEWSCDVERIRQHGKEMFTASIDVAVAMEQHAAKQPISKEFFNPGEKQCQFCKAKAECPALRAMTAKACYGDFGALEDPDQIVTQGDPLPPRYDRLGAIYGQLDLIEAWIKSVREEVTRQVMAGMTVIGMDGLPMRLAAGRAGNRAWKDEKQAEAVLLANVDPEKVYKPRKLASPADVEKILKKKKTMATWTDIIVPLYHQPPGGPKVVLGSSEEPPYETAAGADEFENLAEIDPCL